MNERSGMYIPDRVISFFTVLTFSWAIRFALAFTANLLRRLTANGTSSGSFHAAVPYHQEMSRSVIGAARMQLKLLEPKTGLDRSCWVGSSSNSKATHLQVHETCKFILYRSSEARYWNSIGLLLCNYLVTRTRSIFAGRGMDRIYWSNILCKCSLPARIREDVS